MAQPIKGFKWVTSDLKSSNGDVEWKIGEWNKHNGKLELCTSGLHGCETALQSLDYILGDRWFEIEARGEILKGDDKFVASEMRIIRELPVNKILVWFAIACARRSLKYYEKIYPDDKRPRLAIEAAEEYMKNPSAENLELLNAAELAAELAARSAAWSAESTRSAAWSAAGSAAWSAELAARSAAWSAAGSARSAAWSAELAARSAAWSAAGSAERKWQEKTLNKIIKEAML